MQLHSLAEQVGQQLKARKYRLATAESCTGGWISQAITAIPGSSDWFDRGFVSYSYAAKSEMLGVDANLLEEHGAVSEEVARQMAEGAIRNSDAQVAIATTGVAGPSGGSLAKPVGMLCFAWGWRAAEENTSTIQTETRTFSGNRRSVREQSVAHSLTVLVKILESLSSI